MIAVAAVKHCCRSVGCGWSPVLATAQVTSQQQWAWAGPAILAGLAAGEDWRWK